MDEKEREVISEFIELYKDLPCLWDLTCKEYKDSSKKKYAWDILVSQLKQIDPAANVASAKKKIDCLRISYTREFKKVKESKNRTGSAASDIHKPSLWYYELMTFLEKKNEDKRLGVDSLMSEDEDDPQFGEKKRKKKIKSLDLKKERLMDAAHNFLRTDTEQNPFGVYVGKKMEEILPGPQRDIAEKLISDVLFFAKSSRLTFETKIEIPSSQYSPHSEYLAPSPQQCSTSSNNSNRFHIQSPYRPSSHTDVSPQYICHPVISPPLHSPAFIQSAPRSSHAQHNQLSSHSVTSPIHQSIDGILTEHSYSSEITHANSTSSQNPIITVNDVIYTEGPAGILNQMLLFQK